MASENVNPTQPSVEDLTARLEALERENAVLRRQATAVIEPTATAAAPPVERRRRHWVRSTFAVVLITLGAILAPVAVIAHWAQRELTDTDRYLATVGPLASDPVIQSAIIGRATDAVMEQIDVPSVVDTVSGALEDQGLTRVSDALGLLEGSITGGVENFVRSTTAKVVESDAFETLWIEANRTGHEQLVAVMQGDESNVLQLSDEGTLTIQLSGVIEEVKAQLVEAGFGIAEKIPEVDASFTIVQSTELVRLQNAYNAVVMLGTWLPWLSIGLLAAGVLTAVHRSRALVTAGLALAGSMLVLGVGLTIGRSLYLNALAGKVERLDAAEVVFDQMVEFIRLSLRTVGVLGLAVAIAGFLGGGSESARGMRAGIAKGFAAARGWGENRGVSTGPVGAWLFRYRAVLRVAIIVLAAAVILLAATPTPALIVVVALVAGLLIAVLELLARPPAPTVTPEALPAGPASSA